MNDLKRKNEENLASLRERATDFANVGIYSYRLDGTLVSLDRGTLRFLDLEDEYENPTELIGVDIGSLFEHVMPVGYVRSAVMEKGEVRQFEYCFRTLSGKERWVYHNSWRDTDTETGVDLIQVIAQDITPLKNALVELESSEARYRALAEETSQGILVVAYSGKVLFCNRAMLEMTGVEQGFFDEMSLERLFAGIHEDDRARVTENFSRRAKGEEIQGGYELRLVRPDGAMIWATVNVSSIWFDNQSAAQVLISDITERKEMEQREREREGRLAHAQKLESLGVMAGGIAHDFNNLLAAIMANADMARSKLREPDRVADHLDGVCEAASQAAQLCQQLLAYAGRGRLSLRPVDLNQLVSGTVELQRVTLAEGVRLSLSLGGDLPAVQGDPTQLRQIVSNLVKNAADAMGDGGGEIRISTGAFECDRTDLEGMENGSGLTAGRYLRLIIEDDGVGMDRETESQIFDPFFTTKFTGRGLGLASVLGIIKGHRGAIAVESEPGEGTRFTVLLPALEGVRARERRSSEEGGAWRGKGVVLAADDEPSVLEVLSRALEEFGFEVIRASDGTQALELFERAADKLSLVILDVTMPRMGGLEACTRMREIRPAIPVIFSSGYNEQDLSAELDRVEATGFLRKPYRIFHLERLLKKFV